ncbi:MAG: putative alkaline serine protease (subtilase family protein) [Bryobacterales bacterium]|nr:putative alkaline serine protease (subtilase family protein) [Bryobacterales bacterium]
MIKTPKAFSILITLFVSLSAARTALAQSQAAEHVPGRILVQPAEHAPDMIVQQLLALFGGKRHHKIDAIGVSVVELPEAAVDRAIEALSNSGMFTFVERDHVAHSAATPNDPDFATQWHLAKIQAASAWSITQGAASVPIAIIDSGIDLTHADLASKVIPGWNFLTGTSNVADTGGHGTAVSGTAAAATNNLTGVAGVAWANTIMPLVVLNSSNYASYSDIASAINYAADHGTRIISISIGGPTSSSTLQSAVDYAWNKGAVIFAAAMNNSSSAPSYPAACNHALAISATEPDDTLASFSNYGNWIKLSAPGDSIMTTEKGGGYWSCWGTSFATPIAAAVGALALSVNPQLSASALVSLLENNSDDLGTRGFDNYYGWGRVNAYKAVLAAKALLSTDMTPPAVNISAPGPGQTVSGAIFVQGTATDNVGVNKIELDVDGIAIATATASPFSFSWNSSTAANGSHSVVVKASDAANNVGSVSVSLNVSNSVADTTPPTVSITAPVSTASVSGTISVQGSASDNVGVTKVELDIDGVAVATVTASPFSFSWNSTTKTNGLHSLTVQVYDAANNAGSASVSVSVNNPMPIGDTTPPVATITQPVNGSSVSRMISLAVSANDNVGVTRVSIYVDNVQICSLNSAPYACNWNARKASPGAHTITATAWDAAGNVGKAVPIAVTR